MRPANMFWAAARKIKLSELGKNAKPLKPVKTELPKTSSLLQYILGTMTKHPGAVVLTQVGSFYEMYFEQAVEFGPKLNLKIAKKSQYNPQTNTPFVNMTGFPCYQLDRYVKTLVQSFGKTVVILDQDPKQILLSSLEEQKRPISRILTPGTLVSESFVDSWKHNYLAAIHFNPSLLSKHMSSDIEVGLAWADLQEGTVQYQTCLAKDIPNELVRINPSELLLDNSFNKPDYNYILKDLELEKFHITFSSFPIRESLGQFAYMFMASSRRVKFLADTMKIQAQAATSALMAYIQETLPGAHSKYEIPHEYNPSEIMKIDSRSRQSLELFQALARNSERGAFFNVIRRTVTPSGSRLLQDWLTSPLQDKKKINFRLDLVALLAKKQFLRKELSNAIKPLPDGRRVIQKIGLRKFDPLDLIWWADAVTGMKDVAEILKKEDTPLFRPWLKTLEMLKKPLIIANKIKATINAGALLADREDTNEEILHTNRGSYQPILQPEVSSELTALYKEQEKFPEERAAIQRKYEEIYDGKATVHVRWTPLYGHHINLKTTNSSKLSLPMHVLAQTKKSVSLIDSDLVKIGTEYDRFLQKLQFQENKILESLRNKVIDLTEDTRACLDVISIIDVIQSLASLALEKRLVRPQLSSKPVLRIKSGRHISVESGLLADGASFVDNDTSLDTSSSLCMVTGPNMGGKSTYIRQNALMCLLAHIGSFVPAEEAEIGIIDKIFCRIGSGDDIYRGRSTFMMEMLETANILSNATPNSLAILDEVGRGTSNRDGLAIAFATVKHLVDTNKCRTLFATHFGGALHEVLENEKVGSKTSYLRASLIESASGITIDHKLRPGVCKDSQGLLIAEIAGFPKAGLDTAHEFLERHPKASD